TGALVYSSYIGGTHGDGAYVVGRGSPGAGVAVAADGSVLFTSGTLSDNFPTANAEQPEFGGVQDHVGMKFNPDFTSAYSTYLGGTNNELGYRIDVDRAGNAYVLGSTSRILGAAWDFPTTAGAFQMDSTEDAVLFVARFSPTGHLDYATFFGAT